MTRSLSFYMAAIALIGIVTTPLSADIIKGQKWYTKNCKECHGTGTKGAAMHTQDEWDGLFLDENTMIIKKHEGTQAENYFKGNEFKERSKHIRDFLFEYGSDSGNVPAC